jgi:hypothetical protein
MHQAIIWKGNWFPNYIRCETDQVTQAEIGKACTDEFLCGIISNRQGDLGFGLSDRKATTDG